MNINEINIDVVRVSIIIELKCLSTSLDKSNYSSRDDLLFAQAISSLTSGPTTAGVYTTSMALQGTQSIPSMILLPEKQQLVSREHLLKRLSDLIGENF